MPADVGQRLARNLHNLASVRRKPHGQRGIHVDRSDDPADLLDFSPASSASASCS